MFKFILVILAIIGAVSASYEQFRRDCAIELNIPKSSFNKFNAWNFENDNHAPCFIECVMKKLGFVTNGQLNVSVIAEAFATKEKTAEDLKPEIQACIDNSIPDSCQRIFKGFACFMVKNKDIVIQGVGNLY